MEIMKRSTLNEWLTGHFLSMLDKFAASLELSTTLYQTEAFSAKQHEF